jgi:Winged helix-turn helix
LSRTEQRRLLVLNHLDTGTFVNAQAAGLLGLSVRQVRRLRGRYREQVAAAQMHGTRGRRPGHATDPAVVARVVELAKTKYIGYSQSQSSDPIPCCGKAGDAGARLQVVADGGAVERLGHDLTEVACR